MIQSTFICEQNCDNGGCWFSRDRSRPQNILINHKTMNQSYIISRYFSISYNYVAIRYSWGGRAVWCLIHCRVPMREYNGGGHCDTHLMKTTHFHI